MRILMPKLTCDICGIEYEAYGPDPFAKDKTDGVAIRVYNKQRGGFGVKHYHTCRACATMVQAFIDQQRRRADIYG